MALGSHMVGYDMGECESQSNTVQGSARTTERDISLGILYSQIFMNLPWGPRQ